MSKTKRKIKATCAILDLKTDAVISERLIGHFVTRDQASFAAFQERRDGETVCLYHCPVEDQEDMSAQEIAELDTYWDELTEF